MFWKWLAHVLISFSTDEDFARKLQEEINKEKKSRPRPRIDLPSTRPLPPLVGVSWGGSVPRTPAPPPPVVAWRNDNQSLVEIMKEEQKAQNSQNEIVSGVYTEMMIH